MLSSSNSFCSSANTWISYHDIPARKSNALICCRSTDSRPSSHGISVIVLISGSTNPTTELGENCSKQPARKCNALKEFICCRSTDSRPSSHGISVIVLISCSTNPTTELGENWSEQPARKCNALKKIICCRSTDYCPSSHGIPVIVLISCSTNLTTENLTTNLTTDKTGRSNQPTSLMLSNNSSATAQRALDPCPVALFYPMTVLISGFTYLTTELRENLPKKSARNSNALLNTIIYLATKVLRIYR